MKIQTFSIVAGSTACDARCPFCISKMTVENQVGLKEPEVNWRKFQVACRLAKQSGVTTVMLTSKGEPTLFPDQITKFLEALAPFEFPFTEIQSNGIPAAENPERYQSYLEKWYALGLTHYAISVVHYDSEKNRQVYVPHKKSYSDLPVLIARLHNLGFAVRLTCIMADGFVDCARELQALIDFAKANEVEQLTVTPVNRPDAEHSHNTEAYNWTGEHYLKPQQITGITGFLELNGAKLMRLGYGAQVYDVQGQNVCLNSCLTVNGDGEDLRNLIFFPDGHLRYYWQYPGAILL